jgi:hypothetical protein
MKLRLFFSSCLLILCYNLSAQTTITGFVIDSLNKPIPFASVYLSKTTVGTLTDNKGFYSLFIPQNGVYELTASCLGFKSGSFVLSAKSTMQKINIKLSLNLVQLREVTINAKAKIRVRNLTQFDKLFLGQTVNSQNCRILNHEDIHVYKDMETGILRGYSVKPVQIENKSLGYNIIYDLTEFIFDYRTAYLRFSGNLYFQALKGNSRSDKKWTKNRLNTYFGSRLHLLRALFSDSLRRENFKISKCEIDPETKEIQPITQIQENNIIVTRNSSHAALYYRDPVMVSYTNHHPELETGILGFHPIEEISTMQFNDTLKVYRNGYFDNPYSVTWGGKLGNERVADMLPYDYLPYSILNVDTVAEKDTSPIAKYLLLQQKSKSPDQVFVHLDRNTYNPGDTIHFQAYIRNRFTNEFESASVSFYALLFDGKNMKADSSRFRIDKSTVSGWMTIPSNAASGLYRFVAFTSMMQNFDSEDIFQANLLIKRKTNNAAKVDSIYKDKYVELKFLPEGGSLVTGLEQRIGFNATDYRGYPLMIEGLLKNSSGSILDTIKSGIYGPGLFVCKPQQGMYVEIIKGADNEKIWSLPNPISSGICMSVKPLDERSFSVEIQSTIYGNDTMTVSGIMNSAQIFSQEFILNKKQRLVIKTDQLLSGVAQITLFNNKLKHIAERLYYVNPDKHLIFNIKTENSLHRQGQESDLSISVTDGSGNPVEGVFSISVVDSISGHDAEIFTPGIEYTLNYYRNFQKNLPPEVLVKGLENLTNEERDLLLMVYGWSRYKWDFSEKEKTIKDPVNYDLINIKVLNELKNKSPDKKLDLISLEGPSVIHLRKKINEDVILPLDSLPEAARTVTLIPDAQERKKITEATLSIPYNAEFFKPDKIFTLLPIIPREISINSPPDYKFSLGDSVIEIPEVTIKGYQPITKVYQNTYEERYKYTEIKSSDPEMIRTSFDLQSVIYRLCFPRLITDGYILLPLRGSGTSFFGGTYRALFVIDGMPLYSDGWRIAKTIPMEDIASISILLGNQGRTVYGLEASGGVIFINTMFHDPTLNKLRTQWKSQNKNDNLLLPISIYRSEIEFYCPTKFDVDNDQTMQKASTYYWSPEVYFNGDGPVKIRYLNLKHQGPVLISINGISTGNLVGTAKASYRVR